MQWKFKTSFHDGESKHDKQKNNINSLVNFDYYYLNIIAKKLSYKIKKHQLKSNRSTNETVLSTIEIYKN